MWHTTGMRTVREAQVKRNGVTLEEDSLSRLSWQISSFGLLQLAFQASTKTLLVFISFFNVIFVFLHFFSTFFFSVLSCLMYISLRYECIVYITQSLLCLLWHKCIVLFVWTSGNKRVRMETYLIRAVTLVSHM